MKPITAPVGEHFIRYERPAHSGKMQLLTTGGVLVYGDWYGAYGQYFVGWCPLPKRDRAAERALHAPAKEAV